MSTPTPPMPAPRIVPVIGSKGGTGRTTTVVLLAAALARQGHRVAVLDATADGACTEWIEDARADLPAGDSLPFELLAPATRTMPDTSAELVLVDTDGNGTTFERIRPLLDTAALALVPIQPARIDVNSLWDTLDTLEALHPHLPALVLLNHADPTTLTYQDTRAALAEASVSALATAIPERVRYADAVGTVPPASEAWDAAAAELLGRLFPAAPAREREPMQRTSFTLPVSAHERLRWASYTTDKTMGELVSAAVASVYPAPEDSRPAR